MDTEFGTCTLEREQPWEIVGRSEAPSEEDNESTVSPTHAGSGRDESVAQLDETRQPRDDGHDDEEVRSEEVSPACQMDDGPGCQSNEEGFKSERRDDGTNLEYEAEAEVCPAYHTLGWKALWIEIMESRCVACITRLVADLARFCGSKIHQYKSSVLQIAAKSVSWLKNQRFCHVAAQCASRLDLLHAILAFGCTGLASLLASSCSYNHYLSNKLKEREGEVVDMVCCHVACMVMESSMHLVRRTSFGCRY